VTLGRAGGSIKSFFLDVVKARIKFDGRENSYWVPVNCHEAVDQQ
jgi:hypothetical protein